MVKTSEKTILKICEKVDDQWLVKRVLKIDGNVSTDTAVLLTREYKGNAYHADRIKMIGKKKIHTIHWRSL